MAECSYIGSSIFGNIINSKLLGDKIDESSGVIGIVVDRNCNFDQSSCPGSCCSSLKLADDEVPSILFSEVDLSVES